MGGNARQCKAMLHSYEADQTTAACLYTTTFPPTSEGVTLRLRLMACAVLSNASIHPTLTLSRRARDLGLEQLLHGFGGRLRDQLIGKSSSIVHYFHLLGWVGSLSLGLGLGLRLEFVFGLSVITPIAVYIWLGLRLGLGQMTQYIDVCCGCCGCCVECSSSSSSSSSYSTAAIWMKVRPEFP